MEAILTSPSGKSEACEVRDTAGHVYDIRFVPEEDGLHAVSIKYKGIHIAGLSACLSAFLTESYSLSSQWHNEQLGNLWTNIQVESHSPFPAPSPLPRPVGRGCVGCTPK